MESLEYLLQKMDPGVVMLDREGRIRQLNPAARQLLQRYHPALEGRAVVDLHPEPSRRKIAWLLQGGTALVDPAEVVHLQAEGHYARPYTARESFLCHLSLAQLERRLDPEQFLRIHRRHLIAVAHAARLERQEGRPSVVMATFPASRLPIGRSRAAAVAARLGW